MRGLANYGSLPWKSRGKMSAKNARVRPNRFSTGISLGGVVLAWGMC